MDWTSLKSIMIHMRSKRGIDDSVSVISAASWSYPNGWLSDWIFSWSYYVREYFRHNMDIEHERRACVYVGMGVRESCSSNSNQSGWVFSTLPRSRKFLCHSDLPRGVSL
jgi:hypothetical protein